PRDEPSFGLLQLVLAELELERPDDGHGDDGDAGQRLGRLGKRCEVVSGDDPVEAQQLLPGANRLGVVSARPAAAGRVAQDGIWTSLTSRPSDTARRTPVSRSSRSRRVSVSRMRAPTSSRAFGRHRACWAKIGSIAFDEATIRFFVLAGAFSISTRA